MERKVHVLSEAEYDALFAAAERQYYKHIIGIGAFWIMVGFLLGRWT